MLSGIKANKVLNQVIWLHVKRLTNITTKWEVKQTSWEDIMSSKANHNSWLTVSHPYLLVTRTPLSTVAAGALLLTAFSDTDTDEEYKQLAVI